MLDVKRIYGWKSIAAYVGRDRTTVMRWAHDRNLPVRRIMGGERATVFAIAFELDEWTRGQSWQAEEDSDLPRSGKALPENPKIAQLYVQARTDWASRDASSMSRAIASFSAVVKADPQFAPAHAALAECYIIIGDYGSFDYANSYPMAMEAAEDALSIDPNLAEAHRVLGSYYYFWARNTVEAGKSFRRAIRSAPHDSLTRIWYGNALVDNCEFESGRREHDMARLLDSGPLPLIANQAWAAWVESESGAGPTKLKDLSQDYPNNALVLDLLSQAYLGEGDIDAYLTHFTKCESVKGLDESERKSTRLGQAKEQGGLPAFTELAINSSLADEAKWPLPNHANAAFFASATGDRQRLLYLLQRAEDYTERWNAAWIAHKIGQRWRGDQEVLALLEGRPAPKLHA
jgi:tetratricopeptide (TPR) repeat protein